MAALQAWQRQQPAMLEPFLDRLVPALCLRLTDAKESLRSAAERWVINRLGASHHGPARASGLFVQWGRVTRKSHCVICLCKLLWAMSA